MKISYLSSIPGWPLGVLVKNIFEDNRSTPRNEDGLEGKAESVGRKDLIFGVCTKRQSPQGMAIEWEEGLHRTGCSRTNSKCGERGMKA